ncbi:hypothetical protein ACP4OV_016474 [Aristida adscensionis]
MIRAKNPLVADGEVSVQKVKKIEPVYNLITRPSVYAGNTKPVTMIAQPGADVAISRKKILRGPVKGMASVKDIDDYIAKKKLDFLKPGA